MLNDGIDLSTEATLDAGTTEATLDAGPTDAHPPIGVSCESFKDFRRRLFRGPSIGVSGESFKDFSEARAASNSSILVSTDPWVNVVQQEA